MRAPTSKAEVRDAVLAAIRDFEPKLDDKFIDDKTWVELDFDSLDLIETLTIIETDLGIDIQDDEIGDTVASLIEAVCSEVGVES